MLHKLTQAKSCVEAMQVLFKEQGATVLAYFHENREITILGDDNPKIRSLAIEKATPEMMSSLPDLTRATLWRQYFIPALLDRPNHAALQRLVEGLFESFDLESQCYLLSGLGKHYDDLAFLKLPGVQSLWARIESETSGDEDCDARAADIRAIWARNEYMTEIPNEKSVFFAKLDRFVAQNKILEPGPEQADSRHAIPVLAACRSILIPKRNEGDLTLDDSLFSYALKYKQSHIVYALLMGNRYSDEALKSLYEKYELSDFKLGVQMIADSSTAVQAMAREAIAQQEVWRVRKYLNAGASPTWGDELNAVTYRFKCQLLGLFIAYGVSSYLSKDYYDLRETTLLFLQGMTDRIQASTQTFKTLLAESYYISNSEKILTGIKEYMVTWIHINKIDKATLSVIAKLLKHLDLKGEYSWHALITKTMAYQLNYTSSHDTAWQHELPDEVIESLFHEIFDSDLHEKSEILKIIEEQSEYRTGDGNLLSRLLSHMPATPPARYLRKITEHPAIHTAYESMISNPAAQSRKSIVERLILVTEAEYQKKFGWGYPKKPFSNDRLISRIALLTVDEWVSVRDLTDYAELEQASDAKGVAIHREQTRFLIKKWLAEEIALAFEGHTERKFNCALIFFDQLFMAVINNTFTPKPSASWFLSNQDSRYREDLKDIVSRAFLIFLQNGNYTTVTRNPHMIQNTRILNYSDSLIPLGQTPLYKEAAVICGWEETSWLPSLSNRR